MSGVRSPSGARLAVGTVVAKRELPLARALAGSLREHHPDVPFLVLLSDAVEGCFDPGAEPFGLVTLDELAIPGREQLAFRYGRLPLSYALTPWLLSELLDRGADRALCIKQESLVVGPLTPVLDALATHAIALTPHVLVPPAGTVAVTRELELLRAGTINGGVVGVTGSDTARAFLRWWSARLARHCRHAVEDGMHWEQRWLDLVPAMFGDTALVRDPGCNVGHWNLPERRVAVRGDTVTVDGRLASLVRFSGHDPDRPRAATRHVDRLAVDDTGDAALLFERYRAALDAAGRRDAAAWPYAHDRFDDGAQIPAVARDVYLALGDAADRFGDPFATGRPDTFRSWLARAVDAGTPAVAQIWDAVYARRPDVQAAFPDHLGADRAAFAGWIAHSGRAEHGISDALAGDAAP